MWIARARLYVAVLLLAAPAVLAVGWCSRRAGAAPLASSAVVAGARVVGSGSPDSRLPRRVSSNPLAGLDAARGDIARYGSDTYVRTGASTTDWEYLDVGALGLSGSQLGQSYARAVINLRLLGLPAAVPVVWRDLSLPQLATGSVGGAGSGWNALPASRATQNVYLGAGAVAGAYAVRWSDNVQSGWLTNHSWEFEAVFMMTPPLNADADGSVRPFEVAATVGTKGAVALELARDACGGSGTRVWQFRGTTACATLDDASIELSSSIYRVNLAMDYDAATPRVRATFYYWSDSAPVGWVYLNAFSAAAAGWDVAPAGYMATSVYGSAAGAIGYRQFYARVARSMIVGY